MYKRTSQAQVITGSSRASDSASRKQKLEGHLCGEASTWGLGQRIQQSRERFLVGSPPINIDVRNAIQLASIYGCLLPPRRTLGPPHSPPSSALRIETSDSSILLGLLLIRCLRSCSAPQPVSCDGLLLAITELSAVA